MALPRRRRGHRYRGSVPRSAGRVGWPRGRLNADARFLDPIAGGSLEVQRADLITDPLPANAFDLVHARLLLEHLPGRDAVLATLTQALRPGGWLLIEDLDWATATVIDPPNPAHDRVAHACQTVLHRLGYDPYFARTLPRRLAGLGLREVATHAVAIQVRANREFGLLQWELLVDQLTPALPAAGLVTQTDLDTFHQIWHGGSTICFAPLMISTWGRKP